MKIQLSTDKTIHGNESLHDHFTALIATELERYQAHISNIDAHVKDENGIKRDEMTFPVYWKPV